MARQKSTTQRAHCSIETAVKLKDRMDKLEESVKLLIEARNAHALRVNAVEAKIDAGVELIIRNDRGVQTALDKIKVTREEMDKRGQATHEDFHGVWTKLRELQGRHVVPAAACDHITSPITPQAIVVYSNPADGFRYVGPFACMTDAVDYMGEERLSENMWVVLLDAPDKED
jgi:hypothetical protein